MFHPEGHTQVPVPFLAAMFQNPAASPTKGQGVLDQAAATYHDVLSSTTPHSLKSKTLQNNTSF